MRPPRALASGAVPAAPPRPRPAGEGGDGRRFEQKRGAGSTPKVARIRLVSGAASDEWPPSEKSRRVPA
ncbi:hypothetical protein [Amycolatopsis pigmentata]|uniref:Uncharacterized protein n=1 Tax=Amycolatopsis pigmentata TaxID=450801 RepID=A0ABW5FLH3_9PSEU